MRILHCIPSMEGGGAERQLAYLARELVQAGCEIHVALTRGGTNLSRLEASGATIHMLGPLHNHDPRVFLRLFRVIARVRPDLVQCWFRQMELLGGLASMVTGTPWVLGERSSARAYPRRALKNLLRVRIASLAAAIISNSSAGDDYWAHRVDGRVRRYVVQNALPLEEIDAVPAATLAEAGLEPGQSLVLYAGRLDAAKNAPAVVEAVRRLAGSVPVKAILCGDGPLHAELEALVTRHGLTDRVRLAGYVPNLAALMKRAAVFVSPSRFEGSPNVVLEAMACRCPVIVSDIPSHRELLDETTALFVDADDPAALAHALDSIIVDPRTAACRAAAARARAARFDARAVAQRYLSVYQDVVAGQPRRSRQVAV